MCSSTLIKSLFGFDKLNRRVNLFTLIEIKINLTLNQMMVFILKHPIATKTNVYGVFLHTTENSAIGFCILYNVIA